MLSALRLLGWWSVVECAEQPEGPEGSSRCSVYSFWMPDTLVAAQAGLGRLAGKRQQLKTKIESRMPGRSDAPHHVLLGQEWGAGLGKGLQRGLLPPGWWFESYHG